MIDEKAIDQWALEQATAAIRRQWKFPEGARANGATSAAELARAAILAYESAKPKEEGLKLFGLKFVVDDTMPPGVIELRSHDWKGDVVSRVRAMLSAAGGSNDR